MLLICRLNLNIYRGSRRDLGTDCLNGCVVDCLCVETFNRLQTLCRVGQAKKDSATVAVSEGANGFKNGLREPASGSFDFYPPIFSLATA